MKFNTHTTANHTTTTADRFAGAKKFLKTTMPSLALLLAGMFLSGCVATVPMASQADDARAKTFVPSNQGNAGVYIYRTSVIGQALTKYVRIDGRILGKTAPNVFLYTEVAPGEHTMATESEFSDNELKFSAEPGKNYFFEQYIKMGVFVGGAGLEAVSEAKGKSNVLQSKLAQ
jgi:hypothetical protein